MKRQRTFFYKKVIYFLSALLVFLIPISATTVYAATPQLIGMINGGDIYIKSGSITSPWSLRLTNGAGASKLKMYGDRVAYVDSSNNLWLKQGLSSYWYEEMDNVQDYALTENGLLVLQNGGNVWFKSGQDPTGMWDSNKIANAVHVYLSPSQLVVIDDFGNLQGKVLSPLDGVSGVGPDGPWSLIAQQNVSSAAITDNSLVYIDSSQNVRGKNGPIWASWFNNSQVIDTRTTGVALQGTTYCALYTNISSQELNCNPSAVGGTTEYVFGYTVNSFSLGSNGRFVLNGNNGDGNTYLYAEDNSQAWVIESTTGTEITTNQQ